jgi:hypothetical protein
MMKNVMKNMTKTRRRRYFETGIAAYDYDLYWSAFFGLRREKGERFD